jgi:hypothetical protein
MGEETAAATAEVQWDVRYTWKSLNGEPDPDFTYETAESETQAIDRAVCAIDRMHGNAHLHLVSAHSRLFAVHCRRIGTQWWQLVDDA